MLDLHVPANNYNDLYDRELFLQELQECRSNYQSMCACSATQIMRAASMLHRYYRLRKRLRSL